MKFDPLNNSEAGFSDSIYGMITGLRIYFYIPDTVDRSALVPTILHNGGMIKYDSLRTGEIVTSSVTPLDFTSDETRIFIIAQNTSYREYTCSIVDDPSLLPVINVPVGENDNEMIYVSGGDFRMGSDDVGGDATPVHSVQLSPYFMSQDEISNAEFAEVMQWAWENGRIEGRSSEGRVYMQESGKEWLLFSYLDLDSHLVYLDNVGVFVETGYENHPVNRVTWYGAMAFCYFLNLKEGLSLPWSPLLTSLNRTEAGYRLPTEAEWEYAARKDAEGDLSDGDDISRSDGGVEANYCIYIDNSGTTSQARGRSPNRIGIYDMSGNLREWVYDGYDSYPPDAGFQLNPLGSSSDTVVLRGGGYLSSLADCGTSVRKSLNKEQVSADNGFRVVRSSFEGSK